MAPDTLDAELTKNAERYTPWLKLEWARLREDFWSRVEAL